MHTLKTFQSRIKKITQQMKKTSLMVLYNPPAVKRNGDVMYEYRGDSNFLYVTGINMPDIIFCIDCHGESWIFLPKRTDEQIRWMGEVVSLQELRQLGIPKKNILTKDDFQKHFAELLKSYQTLYCSFGENSHFENTLFQYIRQAVLGQYRAGILPISLRHVSEIFYPLRQIKEQEEIQILKEGCGLNAQIHNDLIRFSKSQTFPLWERDLKAYLESKMRFYRAERLAYPSIVAGGNRANILHYEKSNGKISKKDLVLVDAGLEWKYYATDITRTFPAGGKFTYAQKTIYEIVLSAQKKAIQKCKPNSNLDKVHKAALQEIVKGLWDLGFFKKVPSLDNPDQWERPKTMSEVFKKKLYRHFYMHSTSHWLGLDVHDVGIYRDKKQAISLKPNMVFTVEPGIYISKDYDFVPREFRGIGIRIEDDILITPQSYEVLTKDAVKEIEEIESI
ncbi:MAG: aminopeptidase P family protein [Candidatus Hydrogenedentota bacterium]|nr:MAG: aminopeptidase P family protein [Candidatus Hydrogenedentota bacterium]